MRISDWSSDVCSSDLDAAADLDGLVDAADVVAIGPGLGQGAWGNELFSALIGSGKTLLVAADALNILATSPRNLQPDTVLPPHKSEARRVGTKCVRPVRSRWTLYI